MAEAALKREVRDTIDRLRDDLLAVSHEIHANPELAFEEFRATEVLQKAITGAGLGVSPGAYGLETAFESEFGPEGAPLVALLAEYDALPGIGHACGHNLIATASLGAALALHALGPKLPGRVRLLVSSIQCVPEGRGWESWSNFPVEKARLLSLIHDTRAEGLVILSGDSHYAEISKLENSAVGYPLWEATSSGLTEMWPTPGPNPHRVGVAYPETNFGVVHVNWTSNRPMIVFEIYSADGVRLRQQSVLLDSLSIDA